MTINRWFELQDQAVEKAYKRLPKQREIPPVNENVAPETTCDRTLQSLIASIDIYDQRRADLESDGYDADWLQRAVHAGESLTDTAINALERGLLNDKDCPSARHHQLRLESEIINARKYKRFYVDGKTSFARVRDYKLNLDK